MSFLIKIVKRLKKYKYEFIFGTFVRVVGDLCTLYQAYALGYVVTNVSRGNFDYRDILLVLATWCLLMVARQIFLSIAKKRIYTIAANVEMDVLYEGLDHLVMLDSSWHEQENTGNKIKKIQNGASSYNSIIRIWVNNIIEIIVNFIGISVIIGSTDTRVTGFIVIYIVVYLIINKIIIRNVRKTSSLVNIAEEDANGVLYESVNSIRTVKLLSLKDYILKKYKEATDTLTTKYINNIYWSQLRIRGANIWSQIMIIGGVGFIVYGIMHGRYEVGFIALFYSYMGSIRESVSELMNISETIITSRQKIERYELFKDIEINTESLVGKSDFPTNWQNIKFNNVSFSYKDEPVLSSLNLDIKRGEKIGIVGLSGAGKSTLFKLLLKEREDYSGEIFFDEFKLKDISPLSYRKSIGIVLQDTEVFNMSLKDNIVIGAKYDEDYFNKVLEIAHIKDFSEKLKEGVNTYVGEKGIKLSGGERQRLGIARALFKKPEILLLDEATSHLDLESEAKIKDSLHKAFSNVTAIVIAHRLTTIKEMDRILLIEEGKVVEDGNFQELHNKKGRFHDLWEMQKIL